MIFGACESPSEEIESKKHDDNVFVEELLQRVGIGADKVLNVHRLKTKSPSSKPSPLVVAMCGKKDREGVLARAKTLKNEKSGSKFFKVFICPDMTLAQRAKAKEFRDRRDRTEKKRREDEGKHGVSSSNNVNVDGCDDRTEAPPDPIESSLCQEQTQAQHSQQDQA